MTFRFLPEAELNDEERAVAEEVMALNGWTVERATKRNGRTVIPIGYELFDNYGESRGSAVARDDALAAGHEMALKPRVDPIPEPMFEQMVKLYGEVAAMPEAIRYTSMIPDDRGISSSGRVSNPEKARVMRRLAELERKLRENGYSMTSKQRQDLSERVGHIRPENDELRGNAQPEIDHAENRRRWEAELERRGIT